MVGDRFVVEGKLYEVEAVGFTEIEKKPNDLWEDLNGDVVLIVGDHYSGGIMIVRYSCMGSNLMVTDGDLNLLNRRDDLTITEWAVSIDKSIREFTLPAAK